MKDESLVLLRGRLSGRQRLRLVRLLDMLYTPRELAEEIGFSVRQVYRVYVPAGCPYKRDPRGYLWINGKEFRSWLYVRYPKVLLAADEFFCLTCKRPVLCADPAIRKSGRLVYLVGFCPKCCRKLARIRGREGFK